MTISTAVADYERVGARLMTDSAMYRTLADEADKAAEQHPIGSIERDYANKLATGYRTLADTATYFSDRAWAAARSAA